MLLLEEIFNPKYKLYVDMDGVLVDFSKAATELVGGPLSNKENKKRFWKTIKQMDEAEVLDFWSNLEWTSDGQELWRFLSPYNPRILSSPGSSLRSLIEKAKTKWIQKNLRPKPAQVIYETDKWKYADPNSILIDDMSKQINPWVEHGGIGIQHVAGQASQTIQQLKKIL